MTITSLISTKPYLLHAHRNRLSRPCIKITFEKLKEVLSPSSKTLLRYLVLAAGLALLAFAQYALEQRGSIAGHFQGAEIWNAVNKLELPDYDSVWIALPCIFVGFAIWTLFGGSLHWEKLEITDRPASTQALDWRRTAPQLLIISALYLYLIIQLARHQYYSFYPVIWILALAWLTFLIWKWDRLNHIDSSVEFCASDLTLILLLLLIGITLGAFALTDLPNQIILDERPFWEAARAIARGELRASPFDVGVFTFPLSTSILQAWVMRIFGIDLWGWRFSSVVSGVATVIPFYLLARDWFGKRVAFVAGLIMLVNPYFLVFSRLGYNNIQSLFPVVLAIYLWEHGIRRGGKFYLWLGALASGLGYYSFFAAWIGSVTLVLSILVLLALKQIHWKSALAMFAILAIGWILMAAPRIIFALSGNSGEALVYKIFEASFVNVFYGRTYYGEADLVQTMPLIPIGIHDAIFYDPSIYLELLMRGTIRTLLAILDPFIVTEHFMVSGLAGVISPIFFLVGLALSLRHWKQYRLTLLLIWLLGGLFFLSALIAFPPRDTFLIVIAPAFALLSALGLVACADDFSGIFPPKFANARSLLSKALITIGLIIIVIFSLVRFFITLPVTYPASFEDYASWIAWRTMNPVNIVYATARNGTIAIQDLVTTKLILHRLFIVEPGSAIIEAIHLGNEPTIVFYEGTENGLIEKMRDAGYEIYAIYRSQNNDVLGFLFTNTSINLKPGIEFKSELFALIHSPVTPLLVFLFVALLVVVIRERKICLFVRSPVRHA